MRIDIGIPVIRSVNLSSEPLTQGVDENEPIIKVTFQMQIGEVIKSEIMQIIPAEFSRQMLKDLMQSIDGVTGVETSTNGNSTQMPVLENPSPTPAAAQKPTPMPSQMPPVQNGYSGGEMPMGSPQGGYPPQAGNPYPGQNDMYQGYGAPPFAAANQMVGQGFGQQSKVQVQPAQFATLNAAQSIQEYGNIGLIMDVPLQISVELGKTRKTIKEILALGPGSILELDKLAGEPVDLLVNGKLIAKGEVVVIDENFGVRVTDIVSPMERVANLQ
jgi:flagellar motor switch protein FliN/FliY